MRIELFVESAPASVDFLTSVLGFEVLGGDGVTGHTVLDLEGSRVAVQAAARLAASHPLARRGPRGIGVEIVLPVVDVRARHAAAGAAGAPVTDLVRQPWGLEDFRVQDPDGYYFRVTSTG